MSLDKRSAVVALSVLAIDQISKFVVERGSAPFFLSRQTPGIIFGYDLPGFWDFYLTAGLLLVFVFVYFRYLRMSPASIGSALIIGGAFSNLADRLLGGTVTDFIDLGFTVMNFADLGIFAGIFLLAYKL